MVLEDQAHTGRRCGSWLQVGRNRPLRDCPIHRRAAAVLC
jgi:hypothetical protein